MTKYLPFVYDKHQFFTNDKTFIVTGASLEYLTCFFNSQLFKFAFKERFPELLGDTRELRKVFFDQIPVKPAPDELWFKKTLGLIETQKEQGFSTDALEREINEKLFDIYEMTDAERDVIRFSLGVDAPSRDSISAMSLAESE